MSMNHTYWWHEAKDGYRWVSLDVTVTYYGSEARHVSIFDFVLRDSDGYEYQPDFMGSGTINKPAPDGDISNGSYIRGILEFQIPYSAIGLKLGFDTTDYDDGGFIYTPLPKP